MSYYANGSGSFTLEGIEEEALEQLLTLCKDLRVEVHQSDDFLFEVSHDAKYYEDRWKGLFEHITPYTVEGRIEFLGESGALWKFEYKDGKWNEDLGHIYYEDELIKFLLVETVDHKVTPPSLFTTMEDACAEMFLRYKQVTGEDINTLSSHLSAGPYNWYIFPAKEVTT